MKKFIAIISIVFITALIFLGGFTLYKQVNDKFSYLIVIDAGHGGIDGGVTSISGVKESEINLTTAYELKAEFENSGYAVTLTRTDENGLYGTLGAGFKLRDLKKRCEIINGSNADALISIHMNKYNDSRRRGAQVFYKQNDKTSNFLGEKIQNRLNIMSESVRAYDSLKGDYYVLNYSKIPSVIVECGFLSNPTDEALLLNKNYRLKLVKAIRLGVDEYLSERYS